MISVLTVVGVLVMMFVISPLLALIALVTVPLAALLTRAIAKRSQPQFMEQWAATGKLNGHIEEAFTGHEVVKVFGRQEQSREAFDEHNDALFNASFKAQFISGIIQPSMMFISNINYVAGRRDRRVAGRRPARSASATCRRSSSTRGSSPSH